MLASITWREALTHADIRYGPLFAWGGLLDSAAGIKFAYHGAIFLVA